MQRYLIGCLGAVLLAAGPALARDVPCGTGAKTITEVLCRHVCIDKLYFDEVTAAYEHGRQCKRVCDRQVDEQYTDFPECEGSPIPDTRETPRPRRTRGGP